jgi:hypothetical protein
MNRSAGSCLTGAMRLDVIRKQTTQARFMKIQMNQSMLHNQLIKAPISSNCFQCTFNNLTLFTIPDVIVSRFSI